MAAARADTLLAFNVVAAPADGLQARKKLERALHEWFQGERCRRFVLFGPGGAGKSTLAVKFAAAQVERGGDGGTAAGVCAVGVEHGARLRGAARSVPSPRSPLP